MSDYKIKKYTHKLKYATNKEDIKYYKEKIASYKQKGGSVQSTLSPDAQESINNINSIFEKKNDDVKFGYPKEQVDLFVSKIKSDSEEFSALFKNWLTDIETAETELKSKNQQLSADRDALIDNNKIVLEQVQKISTNAQLDNFTEPDNFKTSTEFFKELFPNRT